MKILWWQGGLHFEPDSDEDRAALMRLWEAEKVVPQSLANVEPCSTGVIVEETFSGNVA
jgi:hypothetical protein